MNRLDNFKMFESSFFKKQKEKRKQDEVLKKADNQLKEHLKNYMNSDHLFQYSVYVWKSPHENYLEVDIADFKFINIMIEPRYDWNSGKVTDFFLYLYFIDRYGDEIAVHYEMDSPTEKTINLEYAKPWELKPNNSLNASYVDDNDGKEIDYQDMSRYPTRKGGGAMYLVPGDYKTIQFLNEIKSALQMINDSYR